MRVGLVLSLMVAWTAPWPLEALPMARAQTSETTILLDCDDAELKRFVAAELRAAGFVVVEEGAAASVAVEVASGSRRLRMVRDDDRREVVLSGVPAGGMSHREAEAIRVVETLRGMLDAGARSDEPHAPASVEPTPAPVDPVPPSDPTPARVVSVTGVDPRPVPAMDLGDVVDAPLQPAFGLGVVGGAGVLTLRHGGALVAAPAVVAGLRMRGYVADDVSLVGLVAFETSVADATADASDYDIIGGRAALLASWEVLGARRPWTPALGGGLVGEIRSVAGFSAAHFDDPHGEDACSRITIDDTALCHTDFGLGAVATAGIHFRRPWRFGLELLADIRVATIDLQGRAEQSVMPAVLGVASLEYDLVSTDPPRQVARR